MNKKSIFNIVLTFIVMGMLYVNLTGCADKSKSDETAVSETAKSAVEKHDMEKPKDHPAH